MCAYVCACVRACVRESACVCRTYIHTPFVHLHTRTRLVMYEGYLDAICFVRACSLLLVYASFYISCKFACSSHVCVCLFAPLVVQYAYTRPGSKRRGSRRRGSKGRGSRRRCVDHVIFNNVMSAHVYYILHRYTYIHAKDINM